MDTPKSLSGARILDAVARAGVDHVIAVPDISTSEGLLFPLANDTRFRLIRVCKEDEAIGIAAALSYCSRRALVLIQHTGFLDSVNAVRAVAVEFDLPVCMMIGLLNKEPDVDPRDSREYGVRITQRIVEAMEVEHTLVDNDADIDRIVPAIDRAYAQSRTTAMLLGRRPTRS